MLHRRGVEIATDSSEQRFAVVAVVAEHPDLDELMREQIDVDFVENRGGQSVLTDRHDRMEGVGPRTEGAAFSGC